MRLLIFLAAVVPLAAQWIHYPTPGIPRMPDGKPNLSAPAPKTRSEERRVGKEWRSTGSTYYFNITADGVEAPLLHSAAALYKQRLAQLPKGHPSALDRG